MMFLSKPRAINLVLIAVGLCSVLGGCNRESAEKFIASGKTYLAQRDYAAAVIQFKNALQKTADNAEARYLMAVSLSEMGDSVSAEVELRKAIAAGYPVQLAYPQLVQVLLQQGQYDKALAEAALHQDDKSVDKSAKGELLALSGEAYLGLGRQRDANTAFSAARHDHGS